MFDLVALTQRLVGPEEHVQYIFFADEGTNGDWVYSRATDFIFVIGPTLKMLMAKPRLVAVTDRMIVLIRGGVLPRRWKYPQEVIDRMPLDTPVSGALKGHSSYITIGTHRLWVRQEVFPFAQRLLPQPPST